MGLLDPLHSTDRVVADAHALIGAARLHHVTDRGGPLGFAHAPFLVEMYRDLLSLDELVVCKAVQVHVSELLILSALYEAGWLGRTVAYVLPTHGGRDNFVQRRIDRELLAVPEYRRRYAGEVDARKQAGAKVIGNLKRKQFGPGFLLFLGSNAPAEFLEFSADSLIVDEYDHCDPENLAKANDRIRESPLGPRRVRFGNPTMSRIGISALYDDSDGRRFWYRCEHCGESQPTDWEISVVRRRDDGRWEPRDSERAAALTARDGRVVPTDDPARDIRPVCVRCSRPYDRSPTDCGWVAARPDAGRVRGYRVSRLDMLRRSLSRLYDEWVRAQGNSTLLAAFHRSVLGLGYEGAGAGLTVAEIDAACTAEPLDYAGGDAYDGQLVTAGIDVGAVFNVTVSTAKPGPDAAVRHARWVGAVTVEDEVVDVLRRYRVTHAVIDMMPETRVSQSIRDRAAAFGCDVWLCKFAPRDRVGREDYGRTLDYPTHVVTVDRTQVIDAATDAIRNATRVFPSDVRTVFGFVDQMRAPKRGLDPTGRRIVWSEGNEPDHFRFADLYDLVAYDIAQSGGRVIEI